MTFFCLVLFFQVADLAKSLGLSEDCAYTCETAENFFIYEILARWEKFKVDVEEALKKVRAELKADDETLESREAEVVARNFPFNLFFSDVQPLFAGGSLASDMEVAEGCFRHVSRIFDQLKDCRAFELLRSSYDRGNYLLMKQAKIIAMTCTHAALKVCFGDVLENSLWCSVKNFMIWASSSITS